LGEKGLGPQQQLDCSDTIFIENEQIEALGNRPAWVAVVIEQGLPATPPDKVPLHEGVSPSDDIIAHVMDVGANYWSLWNFHAIKAENLMSWYEAFPKAFDTINRRIGYRVRPSMVWSYEDEGYLGLIVGFANNGIAAVPGVLRATVENGEGKTLTSGCLDAGYPLPGRIRQAQFVLPKGTKWQGLKLKAEIEVKGVRYPVRWACHQKLNEDGSLTLRPNGRHAETSSPYNPPSLTFRRPHSASKMAMQRQRGRPRMRWRRTACHSQRSSWAKRAGAVRC